MLATISQTQSQWRRQKRPKQPQLALGISVLSPRERQVLERRAMGMPYKLIAPDLGISIHTAKQHASHVFEKLCVKSSLEAVRMLLFTDPRLVEQQAPSQRLVDLGLVPAGTGPKASRRGCGAP